MVRVISRRFFFFKQKTAYEMRISDWSSDVCSSDLEHHALVRHGTGNTRLRLRAESVLRRGAGTAGRGLAPGVSANSPSPGLPGAWRRVAVNRKPTHDLARYDMSPATSAEGKTSRLKPLLQADRKSRGWGRRVSVGGVVVGTGH